MQYVGPHSSHSGRRADKLAPVVAASRPDVALSRMLVIRTRNSLTTVQRGTGQRTSTITGHYILY